MNQLFVTLRIAEAAAEKALPMLETVLRSPTRKGQARVVLGRVKDILHRACEKFERSDFVDDEGGPYVRLFDALSYVTYAHGSYDPPKNALESARRLLASLSHQPER